MKCVSLYCAPAAKSASAVSSILFPPIHETTFDPRNAKSKQRFSSPVNELPFFCSEIASVTSRLSKYNASTVRLFYFIFFILNPVCWKSYRSFFFLDNFLIHSLILYFGQLSSQFTRFVLIVRNKCFNDFGC